MRLLVVLLAGLALAACGGSTHPRATEAPAAHSPRTADLEGAVVRPTGAAASARCTAPVEVIAYAQDDWLGLARTFAAAPPGCVEAWIGVPTIEGADRAWITTAPGMKEKFARIGPNVHPMPTVDVDDWTAWGLKHPGVSWRERGAMALRGMQQAGYDFAAGDRWALNEVPIAAETDAAVRADIRDLLIGLHGDAAMRTGVAYAVIPQQTGGAAATTARFAAMLGDRSFWVAADRAILAWSDEAYADVRNTCEPGATYLQQADALAAYAYARRTAARAAAAQASPEARAVLERVVPLANAAWRWPDAYGWTDVPAETMADFVRVQVHAMARPSGRQLVAGFAWAPKQASPAGLSQIAAALRDELVIIASDPMRDEPKPCSWPGARIAG